MLLKLTIQMGETRLLKIFFVVGVTLNIAFAFLLSASDSFSASKKICRHYSSQDLDVFLSYQVQVALTILGGNIPEISRLEPFK